jgi:ATP-binding cassette subfamily G (WHITE) protein 2
VTIQNHYKAKAAGSEISSLQGSQGSGFKTDRFHQFVTIMTRALLNILRNPTTSTAKIANSLFISLILGGVYFNVGDEPNIALQNRLGAMFFIAVTVVMSNIPGIELFSAQRTIFRHEVMSGYYHTLPYFLGRVAVDVLLFRMIPTAMLYTIAYYMIDFGGSFADLLFILLIGILSSVAGSSLAFFISSVILHPSSATVVLTMIFDIMMVH